MLFQLEVWAVSKLAFNRRIYHTVNGYHHFAGTLCWRVRSHRHLFAGNFHRFPDPRDLQIFKDSPAVADSRTRQAQASSFSLCNLVLLPQQTTCCLASPGTYGARRAFPQDRKEGWEFVFCWMPGVASSVGKKVRKTDVIVCRKRRRECAGYRTSWPTGADNCHRQKPSEVDKWFNFAPQFHGAG